MKTLLSTALIAVLLSGTAFAATSKPTTAPETKKESVVPNIQDRPKKEFPTGLVPYPIDCEPLDMVKKAFSNHHLITTFAADYKNYGKIVLFQNKDDHKWALILLPKDSDGHYADTACVMGIGIDPGEDL